MTAYERTVAVIEGRPVDRLPAMPIFMRWLGPRIGCSYRDYCLDGHDHLIAGQQHLVDEYGIYWVCAISDAWREAADCGAELVEFENEPPAGKVPLLSSKSVLGGLSVPKPDAPGSRMSERVLAVAGLNALYGPNSENRVPVSGWIEGPIAAACNLRGMNHFMLDLMDDGAFAADLLDFCTEMGTRFALAQVKAGADIIGLGDAAASLCGPRFYEDFILPREQAIIAAIHDAGALVRLHICGNTNDILSPMATTGADIIDLDHAVDVEAVRPAMGDEVVIAGNFDPVSVVQDGTPADVTEACRRCHEAFGPKFIVNAGCEIATDTPVENVRAMFDYARDAQV